MRKLMLFLILSLMVPYALSQTSSTQENNRPLTAEEKRQILHQLIELESARAEITVYKDLIAKDQQQDERERALHDRELEVEKARTALTQKELDLQVERTKLVQEKADTYKLLWEQAIKSHSGGIGCFLKKVFTLGIARCGG